MEDLMYESEMPFLDLLDVETRVLIPGFHVKFVHSSTMTFAHWDIEPGSVLPEHSHPHEQVCNVIEGEFELTIDGESRVLKSGGVGVIPSNAVHSGKAVTRCHVIDVFHPIREDYR
jgi:quercetin dioxygenase-like cupin family protein